MASRFKLEKTKSWWFLTPVLELDQYNLNYKYLLNVYLGHEEFPEYKNVVMFHYDFAIPGGAFAKLERNLKSLPNYITIIDPDTYTCLFVFSIPTKWYDDYLLFINGAYSKLSDRYKTLLLNFYKMSGSYSLANEVEKILSRSKERKQTIESDLDVKLPENAEVASIIDWEKEIYNFKQYGIKNPLDKTEFEQI